MPSPNEEKQSIEVGDITNSEVTINQTLGYSIEQHERILKERETTLRGDLERAHGTEKVLINIQLQAIQENLQNLELSYKDATKEIQRLNQELQALKAGNPQIASQLFTEALAALQQNDKSKADILLAKIEASADKHIANTARAAYERGRIAYDEIRWQDALSHFKKAQRLQPENSFYFYWLGHIYELMGDFSKAQPLLEQYLALVINRHGEGTTETAMAQNKLARLHHAQTHYTLAEILYKKAIAIDEKFLNLQHPRLAKDYNNLALLYVAQGKYILAEPLYKKAIAIYEKTFDSGSSCLAASYNNLAGLYDSQGLYAQAEPLYKKAIAIDEIALSVEHPHLAAHYNNLAWLYGAQGLYAQAEPLYKKAVDILEKCLGLEHPNAQTSIKNYVRSLEKQGKNSREVRQHYGL